MARRHVIGEGGVLVIAAGAQIGGDALALEKDLDSVRRQAHLDLAARPRCLVQIRQQPIAVSRRNVVTLRLRFRSEGNMSNCQQSLVRSAWNRRAGGSRPRRSSSSPQYRR